MSAIVKPMPGWVLVRRNLPAKMTAGGIHIPESVRGKHPGITPGEASRVEIIAVDEGEDGYLRDDPTSLQPGDFIYVLATNDNMVPVVNDDYGQVEMQNGFQVPDHYLFKVEAIAGYEEATAAVGGEEIEK